MVAGGCRGWESIYSLFLLWEIMKYCWELAQNLSPTIESKDEGITKVGVCLTEKLSCSTLPQQGEVDTSAEERHAPSEGGN